MEDHILKSICRNPNIAVEDNIIIAVRELPFRMFLSTVKDIDYFAHSSLEVIYMVKGTISFTILGAKKILKEGDLVIVPPGLAHKLKCKTDNIILNLQIGIGFLKENSKIREESLFKNINDGPKKDQLLYELGLFYLELLKEDPSYDNIFSKLESIVRSLESYLLDRPRPIRPRNSMEDIVAHIVESFSEEAKGDLTLSSLAKSYGVSNYYLSRKFREITGRNFTEYYRIHRVNIAIDYLINTDKTISEISNLSGFTDIKALNRDFRRVFNLSASQFRKTYRDISEEASLELLSKENNLIEFLCYIADQEKRKKEGKTYEFDLNKKDVGIYENWNESLALETIIWDGDQHLNRVLDRINIKDIRIKFIYDGEKYYYSGRNAELVEIKRKKFIRIARIFKQKGIKSTVKIDLTTYNKKFPSLEEEVDYSFIKIKSIMKYLKEEFPNLDFSNNRFELYLPNIRNYMSNSLSQYIFKEIEEVRDLLGKNFPGVDLGFYLGQLEALEIEKNRKYLDKFLPVESTIDFFTLDLAYYEKGTYEAREYKEIITRIEEIKEESFSKILGRGGNFIVELRYIMGEESYKIKDYKMPYFNLIFLSFLFKLIGRQFKISTLILEYQLDNGDIFLDYGNFYNDMGIEKLNYYVSKFYNDLGNHFYYIEEGYIGTRSQNKINILFFGDYLNYLEYLRDESLVGREYPKKNINLRLRGLEGRYKISRHRITCNTMFFYYNWIENVGVEKWSLEELDYIRAKSLPEMEVEYVDISGDYKIDLSLEVLGIYFIVLEKIN